MSWVEVYYSLDVFWWFQTWARLRLILLFKGYTLSAWPVRQTDLHLQLRATVLKTSKTALNKHTAELFFCAEGLTVHLFACMFLLFQSRGGTGWSITYFWGFQSLILLPLGIKNEIQELWGYTNHKQ